jgi:hypothetical protein
VISFDLSNGWRWLCKWTRYIHLDVSTIQHFRDHIIDLSAWCRLFLSVGWLQMPVCVGQTTPFIPPTPKASHKRTEISFFAQPFTSWSDKLCFLNLLQNWQVKTQIISFVVTYEEKHTLMFIHLGQTRNLQKHFCNLHASDCRSRNVGFLSWCEETKEVVGSTQWCLSLSLTAQW